VQRFFELQISHDNHQKHSHLLLTCTNTNNLELDPNNHIDRAPTEAKLLDDQKTDIIATTRHTFTCKSIAFPSVNNIGSRF
jgi:hypothetical protein